MRESNKMSSLQPSGVEANPLLPFNENQTRLLFKAVRVLLKKSTITEERSVKAPQPSPFKGDPEDLERFLQQLENIFALENRTFKEDIRKIPQAGMSYITSKLMLMLLKEYPVLQKITSILNGRNSLRL